MKRDRSLLAEARAVLEEAAWWRSKKAKTWTDEFGDTVFPEFDKPETHRPEDEQKASRAGPRSPR